MTNVTVAYGDGIGPEIMTSVLEILQSAGAKLKVEVIEIGHKIYEKGWKSGITDSTWDTIKRSKVLLKAPITTPRGHGVRSLNVTLRKKLGLFANIRPCVSYLNKVNSNNTNLVIIRENEEDLYSGIEYRQTKDTYNCIKVITKSASEKICRYAFEYAKVNNRKKVTCLVKDNIMKMTDGIFHLAFKEVAKEYPQIESNNYIIDIGAARIATRPNDFDVVVTSNLYGDIVSDIAAEVVGSVGLCGSVNLGKQYAMFEAVHGSAPDIAGKNIANPSGLLNAAIYMLGFIDQREVADKIYKAWSQTIEDGLHTADIFDKKTSKAKISTTEFTKEVIKNLNCLKPSADLSASILPKADFKIDNQKDEQKKLLIGADCFIAYKSCNLDQLLESFKSLQLKKELILASINAKGIQLWPEKPITSELYSDVLCCRFLGKENSTIESVDIKDLFSALTEQSFEVIKLENLYLFGDKAGFSM